MKKNILMLLAFASCTLPMTAQTETLQQVINTLNANAANQNANTATQDTQGTRTTAQTFVFRYGFVNADSVLHAMPEYAMAQRSLTALRQKYDREMKRSEDDFNIKYESFLEQQRDLVPSILHKRQAELQDMMEKNIAFKAEARRLLAQAEADAMAPLREQINELLQQVAKDMQLAFVLNTGSDACPYVNPAMSVDITDTLIDLLKKRR
ncbi:MAG: OmpH family outer membrane protein [Prevotella sp.]|nr:OmpH family outer membrane protein [Prevotella sp.]